MREANSNVLVMEPIKSSYEGASEISPSLDYANIRKNMLRHPRADGIYIQGNAWRVLNMIDRVGFDLGVPVVYANCSQSQSIQKIFWNASSKGWFWSPSKATPLIG